MPDNPGQARTAIVIGGGIAGMVAAIALRKAGIEADVYEAYPGSAVGVGGALTLAPNGMAALAAVGLATAVEPVGEATPRMVMETGTGRHLGTIADLPGLPVSQTFARAELYATLLLAARGHGVSITYGKRLIGYEQRADRVIAQFADGSRAAADVLIAADGIHSTVRDLLDPAAPAPRYVGLLGLGGWVAPDGLTPTGGAMHLAFGRKAFFGYWVSERRAGWFANLASAVPLSTDESRATPAGEWLRRLRSLYAQDRTPALTMLDRTTPESLVHAGGMYDLPPVPTWWRDRVVLLGDAAHATSPSSGQGASLAIESAVELARCLRDRPIEAAFRAYEELRRPRVELIIKRTSRINHDKAPGPIGRVVRDLTFGIAMKTFYRPERMVGWIHRYAVDWSAAPTRTR